MTNEKKGELIAKFKVWVGTSDLELFRIFKLNEYIVETDTERQFIHVYKKVVE